MFLFAPFRWAWGILVTFVLWLGRLWQYLIVEQWQKIHEEMDPARVKKVHYLGPAVMCWIAVALTFNEYYGGRNTAVYKWFLKVLPSDHQYTAIYSNAYWALSCSVAYFILPSILIILTPGDRIRDYGLKLKGFFSHIWIYVLLYMIVMPAVIAVSYMPSFQGTYPFYYLADRSWLDLGLWWLFYGIQFFCLEFFFRGYFLHGLKRDVGFHAIFFSALPYCMIHFGKPMLETLGAIIAGVVLGTLSLRTRSIWSGVLIHVSVAYSMDLLALWQKGKISVFM